MNKDSLENLIAEYAVKYKENYYRLAYSYVKNVDDALDIVQESTYKAITSVNTLKNPDFIKTWFYRIVVNTSLDFLRKRKKFKIVDEDNLITLDYGSNDNYEDIDLHKALDNLPYEYRTIVILRYFDDFKIGEIAEILNINVNTVKTRLYTALKKLQLNLSDEELI